MDYPRTLIALEQEEGRKLSAYQDSLGYWTIGVGHLIDERRGGQISDKVADILLLDDVGEKWDEVLARWPWAAALSAPRKFVILSMAFQLGVVGLAGFKDMMNLLELGEFNLAAAAMRSSLWHQQTPGRAERLAMQMETDEWHFRDSLLAEKRLSEPSGASQKA